MNSAPILRSGDLIHMAMPLMFDEAKACEISEAIRQKYASCGITLMGIEWVAGLLTPYVISVIRGGNRS